MLLLPLSTIKNSGKITISQTVNGQTNTEIKTETKTETDSAQSFLVLNSKTNEISEISYEEYVFGVVAAEMPALYEEEALKAQSVAAYTYALRKKELNKSQKYDISNDFSIDQSYITKSEAKEKWGEKAEEYIEKIEKAVKDTAGYTVTYNGQLANTVYHALSCGKTENCKDVWGTDIEYLRSVSSDWDKQAANWKTTQKFSAEELCEKFKDYVTITETEDNIFGKSVVSENGSVKTIEILGKEIEGETVRDLLQLRSQNFKVKKTDEGYTFTVLGYGHGVGMSQYGANVMAQQGSNFKEILTHYYKGCKIEKTNL